MARVYLEYERRKAERGEIDFEDLLELTVRLHESDSQVRATFRDRYRAFTVDEYQDVNLLQQTLLELWLGDRDDVCVVGDDYQSIYGFTGASPRWLLGVEARFPQAEVVRLESNYRSTPEVLELANRLVPLLEGAEKVLRPTRSSGPAPLVERFATAEDEDEWVAAQVKRLAAEGIAYEEMAVLGRTNARLADFEESFHDAGHPVPGLVAALARRRPADAAPARARLVGRDRRARAGDGRGGRDALRAPRQARRARADPPGRPGAPRPACGGARRRRADRRRVRRRAPAAVRPGRPERARRPPDDLPPGEGARVRRGLPAPARGEGAADQACAHRRRDRRGAAPVLRRDHARAATPRALVVAQREPVPRRARPRPAPGAGRRRARRGARR